MGKLQDFVRECIVNCKVSAEINTQSKAEVLLEKFAGHLDDNGGSGGVSSWNDLTDKPFGEEKGEAYIYEETTAPVDPDIGAALLMDAPLNTPVIGGACTVNWNGAEYQTNAQYYTDGEVEGIAIGNFGALSGENLTEEPFVFLIIPGGMNGLYGTVVPLDDSGTVTFSIRGESTIVKTIDEKYLPNSLTRSHCIEIYHYLSTGVISAPETQDFRLYLNMIQKGWTIYANYFLVDNTGEKALAYTFQLVSADSSNLVFKRPFINNVGGENPYVLITQYIQIDSDRNVHTYNDEGNQLQRQ